MNQETTIFRKAKENSKAIVGSIGGAGIMGIMAVLWPFFAEMKDAQARQWQEISALKQRVVVLETKLDFYILTKEKEPK